MKIPEDTPIRLLVMVSILSGGVGQVMGPVWIIRISSVAYNLLNATMGEEGSTITMLATAQQS